MAKWPKDISIIPDESLWGGVWKTISQSNNYAVNEYGVFKSLKRRVIAKTYTREVAEKILPWSVSAKGYARVTISMGENKKRLVKRIAVHRLVAEAFCKDFSKYPQVNHEDGNKLNNHYKNLKPCDGSYNQLHAARTGLHINKKSWEDSQSKSVIMFDMEGKELRKFGSMCEAHRETGISRHSIKNLCENATKSQNRHNCIFKYLQ